MMLPLFHLCYFQQYPNIINTYCTKLFREWVLNSLCEYKRLQEKKPEVLVVFHPDSNRTTISYN